MPELPDHYVDIRKKHRSYYAALKKRADGPLTGVGAVC